MEWGLKKGKRESHRAGKELVQECGVYLSGHYADYLETMNRTVPNWAWLSVLAHGSPEQLRSLVRENRLNAGVRTRSTVWWQAVVFLAGEILAHQDDDRGLDDLRRFVLVPLELEWMVAGRPLQRPGELVRTVLDALDQDPSMRNVPGRKTDVGDAQWICQLTEHGLVRASFIPPPEIREIRELTRYRRTVIE